MGKHRASRHKGGRMSKKENKVYAEIAKRTKEKARRNEEEFNNNAAELLRLKENMAAAAAVVEAAFNLNDAELYAEAKVKEDKIASLIKFHEERNKAIKSGIKEADEEHLAVIKQIENEQRENITQMKKELLAKVKELEEIFNKYDAEIVNGETLKNKWCKVQGRKGSDMKTAPIYSTDTNYNAIRNHMAKLTNASLFSLKSMLEK